jgi:ankyrin repeat protein
MYVKSRAIFFILCICILAGCNTLNYAVSKNDYVSVKKLIDEGADVNESESSWTPLMNAAYHGNVLIAEYLIENGADLDLKYDNTRPPRTFYGFTALHFAAYYGHTEVVKILVDSGADLYIQDRKGITAYDYARQYGFTEIAHYIISSR